MAECPVCGGEVELADDTVEGELIECPECGSELEVLEVDPPRLARPRRWRRTGASEKSVSSTRSSGRRKSS